MNQSYKYAQVFMIQDHDCPVCGTQPHSIALISNSKKMVNAKRVKCCDGCGLVTDAPVQVQS